MSVMLVEVDLDEKGCGSIIIDGKDFSKNVDRTEIISAVGELTMVSIRLIDVCVKGKVKGEEVIEEGD